jgi:hypothetical protein
MSLSAETELLTSEVVSLNIRSAKTHKSFDLVLKLLRDLGIESTYLDALKDQRDQLADIVVYSIERINELTGRTEPFGLVGDASVVSQSVTNFSFRDDSEKRRERGIAALTPGVKYRYRATQYAAPPSALFRDIKVPLSANADAGLVDFDRLAQKFMGIYAKRTGFSPGGALPSQQELDDGISIEENILRRPTGHIAEVEVQIPLERPTPTGLVVSRALHSDRGYAKLEWTLTAGRDSEVDHFMVYAKQGFKHYWLGTVGYGPGAPKFFFMDDLLGGEPGIILWYVRAVYNDMTISTEVYASDPPMSEVPYSYTPSAFLNAPSTEEGL